MWKWRELALMQGRKPRVSLFDEEPLDDAPKGHEPLASRMRPRAIGDVVGQEHMLGDGSALRRAIEEGHPHSMILYGPPGTGKTTLARIVATNANAAFEELSAVQAGSKQVREVIDRAQRPPRGCDRSTVFFLDEIHRFNKAQQDALLPAVEDGTITLIGATTENPYFEVNSALLSRCRIYELKGLVRRRRHDAAAARPARSSDAEATDDALDFLAARAGGDARTALSALELAAEQGRITLDVAEDALQRKAVLYDKGGDRHYDLISAWIKSTRGSDPDASLLYLAAMIEGGEDPRFIARRMVILASEDIGNADPRALTVAVATAARRRARRHARVRAQPRPGGGLPGARAEVERLLPGDQQSARMGARERARHTARAAASRRPTRARRHSAAARVTTTRTTIQRGFRARS